MQHISRHLFAALILALALSLPAFNSRAEENNTMVTIETSMGAIKLELFDTDAPETVKNFLQYVDDGFFDGTIFHRVIDGFMIQGGGFDTSFKQKDTRAPIKNEADNGRKNLRGTIAMARTSDINSATAQFFINVVDNAFLDFTAPNPRGYGYCVFGRVTEGMDVVDRIKSVAKKSRGGAFTDCPAETVEIKSIKRD